MPNLQKLRQEIEEEKKQTSSASPVPSAPGPTADTIQDSLGRTWVTLDKITDIVLNLFNIDGTFTTDMITKLNTIIDTRLDVVMDVTFEDTSSGTYKIGH